MKPADGKLGKKAIYSLYCGNENSQSRDGGISAGGIRIAAPWIGQV